MPNLPAELAFIIAAFRPLFSHRVWRCAQILLIGAILAPGRRTVASALRVMGLSDERHFQNYPSHSESCCLELSPCRSHPAAHAAGHLCPQRTTGDRAR